MLVGSPLKRLFDTLGRVAFTVRFIWPSVKYVNDLKKGFSGSVCARGKFNYIHLFLKYADPNK